MSNESWTGYTLRLTVEVAVRASCNYVRPGSGATVDFLNAAKDLYFGNFSGFALNLLFGSLNVATYGVSSALMEAAQNSGKQVLIEAAKEKAKTDGKKLVGKQLARALAHGVVEQTAAKMVPAGTKFTLGNIGKSLGFSIISSGGYDVPKTVFEDSFQYVGESALERILKEGVKQNAQSFSCEWMEKPIKKALAGHPSKMFALDLTTSATKGMVRKVLNAPELVPFPNLFPANLSADYALNEYWHLSRRKMRRDHHLFPTEN